MIAAAAATALAIWTLATSILFAQWITEATLGEIMQIVRGKMPRPTVQRAKELAWLRLDGSKTGEGLLVKNAHAGWMTEEVCRLLMALECGDGEEAAAAAAELNRDSEIKNRMKFERMQAKKWRA